jgi:hypothetical protein
MRPRRSGQSVREVNCQRVLRPKYGSEDRKERDNQKQANGDDGARTPKYPVSRPLGDIEPAPGGSRHVVVGHLTWSGPSYGPICSPSSPRLGVEAGVAASVIRHPPLATRERNALDLEGISRVFPRCSRGSRYFQMLYSCCGFTPHSKCFTRLFRTMPLSMFSRMPFAQWLRHTVVILS